MKWLDNSFRSLLACGLALSLASAAIAQPVPNLINYQGRLTDQSGSPLSPGTYGIQFRIWDDGLATGTNDLIWGQQQNVTVQSNGVFNAILGSPGGSSISGATPTSLAYAFTGSSRFLGITIVVSNGTTIASPSEILPRQQLLSVPFAFQAQIASSLVSNLAVALCPPGTMVAYGGTSIPPGWLLCNGNNLSVMTYSNLYAAIGTAWGGDGSSYFNVPDLRGVFLRGVDGGRGNDPDSASRSAAQSGGSTGDQVGSYEGDAFAAHSHPAHNTQPGSGFIEGTGSPTFWAAGGQPGTLGMATYTSSVAIGGSTETRPKNAYVNFIIKY